MSDWKHSKTRSELEYQLKHGHMNSTEAVEIVQKLQKKSGLDYSEMLFFDDESRNKNVEELGVVMQLVRDGVTRAEINRGVEAWRKRNNRTTKEG